MSLLSLTKKILQPAAAKKAKSKTSPKTSQAAPKAPAKGEGNALLASAAGLQLLITEKSMSQQAANVVMFRVKPQTSKGSIRQAVEAKYGVKVFSVRTGQQHPKRRSRGATSGRTNHWKKAYVTVDDISKVSVAP